LLADLITIAGLTGLIMVSPGPDLLLVTRNTVWSGRKAGLWTSAGILSGNLIHISYCLLGIGWLIANSIVAFTILKFLGGTYLIYLGIQSIRAKDMSMEDAHGQINHERAWWTQGFLNNILNPKGALFYLGVFAVFIRPNETSPMNVFLLVLTMVSVSTLFWLVFIGFLKLPGIRTAIQRSARYTNRILGGVLIAIGIRLWMSEG